MAQCRPGIVVRELDWSWSSGRGLESQHSFALSGQDAHADKQEQLSSLLKPRPSLRWIWKFNGLLYCKLCAEELGSAAAFWRSYDRLRRRAAHFSSAAAAWLYGRRRRRRRRQTGWESTETAHKLDRRFFVWFYRGQPRHLWSSLRRWRRKVNCEYASCAQFHSLNELNCSLPNFWRLI